MSLNLYDMPGLEPLEVDPDVYGGAEDSGLSGTREGPRELFGSSFMSVSTNLPAPRTRTATQDSESVQELVTRKVRERLAGAAPEAGAVPSLEDFEGDYGLGRPAKALTEAQSERRAVRDARLAARQAARQQQLETRMARKQLSRASRPDKVAALVARKVHERLAGAAPEAGATPSLEDFEEGYGLGKAKARKPTAAQLAKRAAKAAKLAALRATKQQRVEIKQARKLDKTTARAAHLQAMRDLKASTQELKRAKARLAQEQKIERQTATHEKKLAVIQAKKETALAAQAAKKAAQDVKAIRNAARAAGVSVADLQAAAQQFYPAGVQADLDTPYDYSALAPEAYYPGLDTAAGSPSSVVNPLLVPQNYEPDQSYQETMSEGEPDLAADETSPYSTEDEFDVSPADYFGGDLEEPQEAIPSEDYPISAVDAGDEYAGGGMFGMSDFEDPKVGRDGFMDIRMGSVGLPRGYREVTEDEGEQQSVPELDAELRPPMLADGARVGLPYKAGEAMTPMLRKFGKRGVQIADASIVPLSDEDIVGRYGIDPVDWLDPQKYVGMGQLPSAKETAVLSAQAALVSLSTRESQLRGYNQAAADTFTANYATLRNAINTAFAELQAAPDLDLSKSISFSAQVALYKKALDSALAAARPKAVKKPKPATVAAALPAAVKETVFSKYGMFVIGGGVLLIGGLLALNMMKGRTS